MNSMISCSKLLVAAACGAILIGCNAVEDVAEEPFIPVPTQGVVLQGKATGTLGKQRSVTLMNNGNSDGAISVSATLGTTFTPFTFGVVPQGSAYNITVKAQPFGKVCTVTGGTGTVTTSEAMNIVVNCVNDPAVPRFNLRVAVPPAFVSSAGAKVILTTEEGVFERVPAAGATFVQFDSVLFNNVVGGTVWGSNSPATGAALTSTAGGGTNPVTNLVGGTVSGSTFAWTVTASTTVGSTVTRPLVNKCAMTNASNFLGSASGFPTTAPTPNYTNLALPPTTHIGFGTRQVPTVGACTFTIGSSSTATPVAGPVGVYYSTATGGAPQTMPVGGLDLQLRDVQGNVVETLPITAGYGASGTAAGTIGPFYAFTTVGLSNPSSVYDVVVSRHPTGQACVVAQGGAATLGVATANITNMSVACRARPATANALRGTYEFRSGTTYGRANSFGPVPADSPPFTPPPITGVIDTTTTYLSTNNPGLGGSSRGQTVVANATLIGVTTPTTTLTTNTTITRNFLTFFEDGTFLHGVHAGNQVEHGFYSYNPTTRVILFTLITDTVGGGTSSLLTTGLSGTGGAVTTSGVVHATMNNVVKSMTGVNGTISGEFGVVGVNPAAPISQTVPAVNTRWSRWSMTEPDTVAGQVTGTWVTQDHRRTWNYDFNTTLGFHVGVNGGAANMQDACFTFENYRDPAGFYTRRGGLTGCLEAVSFPAGIGTVDYQSPSLANTPGFVGRMPGTETAFDGRSPSPIVYAIGTAANFFTIANPDYFPSVGAPSLAWCTGDVLGVRSTLNGNPINTPVYFCRERAN